MARVLETGGRCAVVVATRHVFYRYRTREVVRTVQNAEIVAQMGVRAGLELTHIVPVELRKRDAVARPRARDSYAETVLVFCKRGATICNTCKVPSRVLRVARLG
jgi:hypothetical protein